MSLAAVVVTALAAADVLVPVAVAPFWSRGVVAVLTP